MGSWRPHSVLYALCLLAAAHSLHAVAFSHVSFVRHVSLQLLSVMSDMSVMSACVSPFSVFSFHLSKYFTFQFSATKCRVNLHDNFVTCFAEGFHVKRFSLLTLLLKGDISERHKKSLFSFLINNLVAVEASCLLRVYVIPIHCGSIGRGLLVLLVSHPTHPFDIFGSVQNSPLFFPRGTSSSRHLLSREISELTYVCGLCGPKRRLPVRVLLPFSLNPSSLALRA